MYFLLIHRLLAVFKVSVPAPATHIRIANTLIFDRGGERLGNSILGEWDDVDDPVDQLAT